jgi:nucleotide-binding universal stress UspA family protein
VIKRILIGLGTTRTAGAVADHAIDLANASDAELTGLTVTDTARLDSTRLDSTGQDRVRSVSASRL